MHRIRTVWRAVDDRLRRHRRLVAALVAGLAVFAGLRALAPATPPDTVVVTAAHDLDSGRVLRRSDLVPVALPDRVVPRAAVRSTAALVGRTLAAPLRAGVPLTDLSVVRPSLLSRYGEDLVAVPVPIGDPTVAGLVRVGEHVVVLAAGRHDGAAVVVADAPVVATPRSGGDTGMFAGRASADRAVVLLAVTEPEAADLTAAAARSALTVALRA